jgi:hypothetical protein
MPNLLVRWWRRWWPVADDRVSSRWLQDYLRTMEYNGIEQSVIQQWPIQEGCLHDRHDADRHSLLV